MRTARGGIWRQDRRCQYEGAAAGGILSGLAWHNLDVSRSHHADSGYDFFRLVFSERGPYGGTYVFGEGWPASPSARRSSRVSWVT